MFRRAGCRSHGSSPLLTAVFFLVFILSEQWVAGRMPGPYPTIFKTEPEFVPSAINVTDRANETDLLEPGYYFIAPHVKMEGYGPQIVDQNADLVWYGKDVLRAPYGGNFYVCDLKGESGNHLCWSESRGAHVILSDTYKPALKPFRKTEPLHRPDVHEFNVLPGGETFLSVIYRVRRMDLRPYRGKKNGFVLDCCLQEVDIRTRKEIFHWCYLKHYEVHETFLYLNNVPDSVNKSTPQSGRGTRYSSWDFLHANAVDKNSEGDYIFSSRHLSQIIKIAGPNNAHGVKPGTTIWRLNGRHSDFTFPDHAAQFGRQHHCRFMHTGANETIISLFNNAFDGALHTSKSHSEGLILKVNNATMEVSVEKSYPNPKGHRAHAQGSMHVLPKTKNVVVGWGTWPEWSEFTQDGKLLFHATVYAHTYWRLTQYRVYKFPWIGRPLTEPKVVAYCRTCDAFPMSAAGSSPVVAYVSWNGATEVATWRFRLSATTKNGPWFDAGEFPRAGFETKAYLSSNAFDRITRFARWVSVDAVAANGTTLGRGVSRTFVPSRRIRADCDSEGCYRPVRFNYGKVHNISLACGTAWIQVIIVAILIAGCIEVGDAFTTNILAGVSKTSGPVYRPLREEALDSIAVPPPAPLFEKT